MGNTLGYWCVSKNLMKLVAEETTSLNNTSPNETDLVVKSFPELPEELVVEILSKLPVKTLFRFKTVCKPWKLLTESPMFIDIHLRRRNPPTVAVFTYNTSQENGHSLSPLPVRTGSIVGTCNGIVCFQPSLPEKRLFLFNPSIREYSFTPDEFHGNSYGFCYLSKTDDKIVSFSPQHDNNNVDIKILTLGKTKSLRHVKDVVAPGWISENRKATSGTNFFWIGFDDVAHIEIVIFYDAIEERFSKMDVPHSSYNAVRSLGVINDSVMMFTYPMIHATFFDIWILVDDVSKGFSWRKYRKIGPLGNFIVKPIGIGWFGRSILCFKYTDGDEYKSINLFYHNLETDEVEDHAVNDLPTLKIANYAESLVSIKSLGLDTTYY